MADTDTLANPIFTALTSDLDLTTPAIDLDLTQFDIPTDTGTGVYATVDRLTQADLTTETVDGTGMFDGLMRSLKAHLKEEHKEGRISGKEYSDAYVAMTQQAMGMAAQYLINRDSQHWNSLLVQSQAQVAQAEVVKARIQAAVAREELKIAATQKQGIAADYALKKQQLANGEAAYDLQIKELARATYEIDTLLPKQALQLDAQTALATAQELQIDAQTAVANAQKLVVDNEAEIGDYRITNMLPRELAELNSKIALTDAEELRVDAQAANITYETSTLLPAQVTNLTAQKEVIDNEAAIGDYRILNMLPVELDKLQGEVAIVDNEALRVAGQTAAIASEKGKTDLEISSLIPAEVARVDAQTADIVYNTGTLAPQQLALLQEQVEVEHGKISDTKTDGLTPIDGVVGAERARVDAQTAAITAEKAKTDYQVSDILPAEKDNMLQTKEKLINDIAIGDYYILNLQPQELTKITNENTVIANEALRVAAQTSHLTAQKDNVLQDTATIIPARASNIASDTAVKQYQHLTLMPAQKEKLVAEELSIMYDKDTLKPAQVLSVTEQTNAHRAKTLDTRLDALEVAGSIGKQKDLHSEQITSYKRDVEAKVAKLFSDFWIAQRSTNPDLAAPGQVENTFIDTLMVDVRTKAGMPHTV